MWHSPDVMGSQQNVITEYLLCDEYLKATTPFDTAFIHKQENKNPNSEKWARK